jgi:hypothetical protein
LRREENQLPTILDLTGQKFGRLTVVSFNRREKRQTYWNCVCDCGKEKSINGNSLKRGNTKSCGCYKKERTHEACFKDLIGKKFGRLTVIKNMGLNKHGTFLYKCKCDCGKETIVIGSILATGRVKSCGCYRDERSYEARFKDLTGQKFGRLTVKEFKGKNKHKQSLWLCLCDCGGEIIVPGYSLIINNTRSCGCYQKERSREECSGEKSHLWQGGISFEPYCKRFNNALREKVRAFFKNECVICGKNKIENDNKNMSVHHVEYDKTACCNDKKVHFVTLCHSCHAKSNKDREEWKSMFLRILDEFYDGKFYCIKEKNIKI